MFKTHRPAQGVCWSALLGVAGVEVKSPSKNDYPAKLAAAIYDASFVS